ncbi:MAG: ABC transporter ATP-binding protein [Lachnospiraceae bacterium]|nr:ABC transporter ATP-binding protein [Lachnospiraceae bacterium]
MKIYAKYVKPYWYAFILGPVLMIVEVVGEVVMPKLLQLIIDNGININGTGNVPYILKIGVLMVITAALMLLGGVGGAYFSIKASVNFAGDLRQDVFEKVQKFSFANIEKFSTGSLVTRLTNDITNVQNLVAMSLRMMLRAPGMFIGALIMAFMTNARLAIVIVIIIPLLSIVLFLIMGKGFPRFKIMQTKIDRLNSVVQENITNARVVKSFVREEREIEKFEDANSDLKDNTLRALKIVIFTMPVMTLAMNITTMAIVWFGGRQILVGDMPIGKLTLFTTYTVQILMSLMFVSFIMIMGSRALASSERIKEVLRTEIDLNDDEAAANKNAGKTLPVVTKGSIEFKNVSFRYYKKNKQNVLSNISFKVEPGQTVGIIGSTGSGKTSMVQLIPRLYDVDEGEVLVDGINVKEYMLDDLRGGVGMVLQKNTLFTGTIEENLRWGNEHADHAEIERIAGYAQADTFIKSFSAGYDTVLDQGGVNVSGGQKQRLCIARALLKHPKILILDDSTSAVDTATEAIIRDNFMKEIPDTTKLIIAQRISSVIDADKIIVLDDGEIAGEGVHGELIKNCETYQEIYYSQMEKEDAV